jgi:polyisoprenoid-binding protein YceI
MKKLVFILISLLLVHFSFAQIWFTKSGYIGFYSHTNLEDIKADNYEAVSFLDVSKGEMRFQVLIKSFRFPKAAMQTHFNDESYMNSDKFPKAEFKGTIQNASAVNFSKDGSYNVVVAGDLTLHGITKPVKQTGTIVIKDGKVSANATFDVKRSDFDISVPNFNAAKIADGIQVTVKCDYEPYKKS